MNFSQAIKAVIAILFTIAIVIAFFMSSLFILGIVAVLYLFLVVRSKFIKKSTIYPTANSNPSAPTSGRVFDHEEL